MYTKVPDFIARIRFLTPVEGGRENPVFQGYRSDFSYLDYQGKPEETLWMIWPQFIDSEGKPIKENIPIAGEVMAQMFIVNTKNKPLHRKRMCIGTPFVAREGPYIVAEGTTTELVGLLDETEELDER